MQISKLTMKKLVAENKINDILMKFMEETSCYDIDVIHDKHNHIDSRGNVYLTKSKLKINVNI